MSFEFHLDHFVYINPPTKLNNADKSTLIYGRELGTSFFGALSVKSEFYD